MHLHERRRNRSNKKQIYVIYFNFRYEKIFFFGINYKSG